LVSKNVFWELERDVMDGTKGVLEGKREQRDEVWRRRERNGRETRGVSSCLFVFSFFRKDSCRGFFFFTLTADCWMTTAVSGCRL